MKTTMLAIALLVTAAMTAARAGGPLDPALEAFERSDYRAAIELVTEGTFEDDATKARAHYLAGECHLALGEPAAAETSFRRDVALQPAAVPGWTGVARALLRQGRSDRAREAAAKAVEFDPKDAEAQRALGEACLAEGDASAAKKPLETAYRLDRKDPLNARALFDYHLSAERVDAAAAIAKRLARDRKKHPMGWFLRGVAADRAGDDDEAIAFYERAIERDETFLDAHKNLAILCTAKNPLYRNRERTKKAMKHYERYFALGGDDPELKQVYETLESFLEQMTR